MTDCTAHIALIHNAQGGRPAGGPEIKDAFLALANKGLNFSVGDIRFGPKMPKVLKKTPRVNTVQPRGVGE